MKIQPPASGLREAPCRGARLLMQGHTQTAAQWFAHLYTPGCLAIQFEFEFVLQMEGLQPTTTPDDNLLAEEIILADPKVTHHPISVGNLGSLFGS